MTFFFNDTATTEIYTLSLHDALPILLLIANAITERGEYVECALDQLHYVLGRNVMHKTYVTGYGFDPDRKSTRLNSSHANISYAVFCLKKKTTRSNSLSVYLLLPSSH